MERIDSHDQKLLTQVGRLRIRAWEGKNAVTGFLPSEDAWLDDHDAHASIWTATVGADIAASARLCIHSGIADLPESEWFHGSERFEPPIAKLSRLVIAKSARGRGIASLMDALRIGEAIRLRARSLVAMTEVPSRIETLERRGFVIVSEAARRIVVDKPSYLLLRSKLRAEDLEFEAWATDQTGPAIPTANGMGWCTAVPSAINLAFLAAIDRPKTRCLDIGAAYGAISFLALRRGAEVTVNDLLPAHLEGFAARATATGHTYFRLAIGNIVDAQFDPESFDCIHASNVLHFLSPAELHKFLPRMRIWLRPGGKIFVQTATPYQGHIRKYLPLYEKKKKAGDIAPGFMESAAEFATEEIALNMRYPLNVMSKEDAIAVFSNAGFEVESAFEYRREALPAFFHLDGRENVGLIALRP